MILLTTLNARYSHTALGLRYLQANMGGLTRQTSLLEFTIHHDVEMIAEQLLEQQPRIIGLGIYIWNIEPITRLVMLLKCVAPEVTLIIGGPEVSHEWQDQAVVKAADYLITGQADLAFAELCHQLLQGEAGDNRVIHAPRPDLDQIKMPYHLFSDTDIAQRLVYVEASRGCPFRCEFCLSSLDKSCWYFDLSRFLAEMDRLYQRGRRQFKFVDRTFNLKLETTRKILGFFLDRVDSDLRLHFELVPDHLPESLREIICRFPEGVLQFEIGIQSLNPEIQQRIDRRQDMEKSLANLYWLLQNRVHIHADLLIGLPGEEIESIANGFNQLIGVGVREIQVGLLKRLRGTPMNRHIDTFQMRYSPFPPYNLLANSTLDFATMQRLRRFARYWDIFGNSGHFMRSIDYLLNDDPFANFIAFSDWIYQTTSQVHKIARNRQFELISEWLLAYDALTEEAVNAIEQDFFEGRSRSLPHAIKVLLHAQRDRDAPIAGNQGSA